MDRRVALAALGFLIGGLVSGFLEWKSIASGPPSTVDAASQTGKHDTPVALRPEARLLITNGGRPRTENGEWRRAVRRSEQENARLADANARPSQDPVGSSKDRRRGNAATANVRETELSRSFQVRVNRILVGEQLVTSRILRESTLDEHGKHNKYIIYFELSFTPQGEQRRCRVSYQDFRLEDSGGLIYSPLQVGKCLSVVLQPGKTGRGGVAFAVYNDSAPARLLYRSRQGTFTPLPANVFSRSRD